MMEVECGNRMDILIESELNYLGSTRVTMRPFPRYHLKGGGD